MTKQPKIYRYDLPGEPEFHPATFVGAGTAILCDDGYFSAVTDYGNHAAFAYSWKAGCQGNPNTSFRHVFLKFHGEYILEKIARKTHFDLQKGIECLKEEGREIPEGLEDIESEHQFQTMPCPESWDGDDFEMFYDYPPQAKHFVKHFIPRLQAMIKDELEAEERRKQWPEIEPVYETPLRYPGGKQKVIKEIALLFPKRSCHEYREPMVGGGSVFMHARNENFAQTYWINDLFIEKIHSVID